MYKVTVIETVDELLQLVNNARKHGDESPVLNCKLTLDFTCNRVGVDDNRFQVSKNVRPSQVVYAALKKVGFESAEIPGLKNCE